MVVFAQVLSAKVYAQGYLVRVRGEARAGTLALEQSMPYMRARMYPMADVAIMDEERPRLTERLSELRDVMRDVQVNGRACMHSVCMPVLCG